MILSDVPQKYIKDMQYTDISLKCCKKNLVDYHNQQGPE